MFLTNSVKAMPFIAIVPLRIIYGIDFSPFLFSSWSNHSGKFEQPKPHQFCRPCGFIPDWSYCWHHYSCPPSPISASVVHHLQTKTEGKRNKYASSYLYTCYEGHQHRIQHFRQEHNGSPISAKHKFQQRISFFSSVIHLFFLYKFLLDTHAMHFHVLINSKCNLIILARFTVAEGCLLSGRMIIWWWLNLYSTLLLAFHAVFSVSINPEFYS